MPLTPDGSRNMRPDEVESAALRERLDAVGKKIAQAKSSVPPRDSFVADAVATKGSGFTRSRGGDEEGAMPIATDYLNDR
jgi:hypothetical protein